MKIIKRRDKRRRTIETMRKTLGARDIWKAIQVIKEGHNPKPYSRTDKQGRHTKLADIAK